MFGLSTKVRLVSVTGEDKCEVSMEWMICITDYNKCFPTNGSGDEVKVGERLEVQLFLKLCG